VVFLPLRQVAELIVSFGRTRRCALADREIVGIGLEQSLNSDFAGHRREPDTICAKLVPELNMASTPTSMVGRDIRKWPDPAHIGVAPARQLSEAKLSVTAIE
jgi:hypothetical protein